MLLVNNTAEAYIGTNANVNAEGEMLIRSALETVALAHYRQGAQVVCLAYDYGAEDHLKVTALSKMMR